MGNQLDELIKTIDTEKKFTLTYQQVFNLLEYMNQGQVDNLTLKKFIESLWNILNSERNQTISTVNFYNLIMIFLGTTEFDSETTEELIKEFITINKTSRLITDQEIANVSIQSKVILKDFKYFDINYSPVNCEETTVFNMEKEKDLVSRLSKKKSPKYTINVENIKNKDMHECTYKPKIHNVPKYIYNKPENPKNYSEAVERIKRVNEERRRKIEAEENDILEVDTRLEKLRKMNIKPPNCLKRSKSICKKERKKMLICVEVAISCGK